MLRFIKTRDTFCVVVCFGHTNYCKFPSKPIFFSPKLIWSWSSQSTKERSFQNFRKVQQAHAERAKAQKEAQARREAARDEAQQALKETGMLNEGFVLRPEKSSLEVEAEVAEVTEVEVETVGQNDTDDQHAESEAPEAIPEEPVAVKLEPEEPQEPEEPEDLGPFEWTGFKDRCLGRLVAEHRYNFKKAGWTSQISCDV